MSIKKLAIITGLISLFCLKPVLGWSSDSHGEAAHGGGHGEAVHADPHGGNAHGEQGGEAVHGGHGGGHSAEHASGAAIPVITSKESAAARLPLWCILLPLMGAVAILLWGHKGERVRNIIVVGTTSLTLLLIISMFTPVIHGIKHFGHLYQGLYYRLNYLPGFDFTLRVDPASLVVALVTAVLWVVSSVYAMGYMKIEEKHCRYYFCALATLAADLGVLMAGDFLTLFIFFEGLIIFPYSLVAHKETPDCMKGANMYLYLGVVSSLSLLGGIALFYRYTGTIAIQPVSEAVNLSLSSGIKYFIAFLMIVGFGGKAGIFFEHIWLPKAHPVAPTPASALLSGAMIKAGAYGIIRVACTLFIPPSPEGAKAMLSWFTVSNVGYVLIWVGAVTMFLGVLNALITANSKKMLAFHSVSQMGYIVLGIGCAAYMGADGAMGLAGALYHIVNHALFKAALFLGVGAVYFRTHELDMYNLGGMRQNMPLVAAGLLIAVCGIAGIPGFNGFASKTILHHAILEAYDFSGHAGHEKDGWLKFIEVMFMLTAGGTFASNIKLFMLTFMGERPKKYEHVEAPPRAIHAAIFMISACIIFVGLFPNWLLEHFIGPALAYFNFDPGSHAYHMLYNVHVTSGPHSTIPILYPIVESADGISLVLHNVMGAGTAVMLGGMYFILGMKYGWFHAEVPEKWELEGYYKRVYRGFVWLCQNPVNAFGVMVDKAVTWMAVPIIWVLNLSVYQYFAEFIDRVVTRLMVTIWQPFTEPEGLINSLSRNIFEPLAWESPWQDKLAKAYLYFCNGPKAVDPLVVDGAVNMVAKATYALGEESRKTQTGFLHQYAQVIAMGLFMLLSLSIYYF